VTTAEIFAELGIGPTGSTAEMLDAFAAQTLLHADRALAPELAHQLALRRILGVRNSTHTIVKILQPFEGAGAAPGVVHPSRIPEHAERATSAASRRTSAATPS
jgi:anthranilate phosphoribosyltransferase